ncbi:uncharacterized protein LOC106155849 [Lingula anatina]|uniref:Uncharacterized protein LOC106155849 n=1 Tax=Lingula anatina TaxID=7574 RepID=A0A1S3HJX1_LINAN|nr:uncharacterized protein LOC106155849 [Lingula anatina]|eukprot:XP_013386317.1 uncharacterized protein LOC106155849 [Lingula anatina]
MSEQRKKSHNYQNPGNWYKGRRNAISKDVARKRKQSQSKKNHHFHLSVVNYDSNATSKGEGLKNLPRSSTHSEKSNAELTSSQIAAFREIFDLFDSNGGGTIDAEEFDKTLRSVGVALSHDEIREIMCKIDKDQSGEIDFEEFLEIMTSTEQFLEAFANNHADEKESRGSDVLYDALTRFLKSCALANMDEIVGFYHTTYKHVQAPHVVGYYAAGARVIGLNEKELVQHFENIRAHNAAYGEKYEKSPYAQQPHVIPSGRTSYKHNMARNTKKNRKRGKIKIKVLLKHPEAEQSPDMGRLSDSFPRVSCIGQRQENMPHERDYLRPLDPRNRRNGWMTHRLKHTWVRLPGIHLKDTRRFDTLTAEDLPNIRTSVAVAKKAYQSHLREEQQCETMQHWKALKPTAIHSRMLRNHFRQVFCAYSAV